MSEKKRSRRRKEGYTGPGEQETEKPSKDEYKVAKWMKSNLKTKKTKFLSHNVEYFTANKAVDALMKSKFAIGDDAKFPSREHVIEFLDIMLEHKFFHRAKKVPVAVDELRSSKSKSKDQQQQQSTSAGVKKEKEMKQIKQEKETTGDLPADSVKSSTVEAVDEHSQEAESVGGCSTNAVAPTVDSSGQQQQQTKRKRKIRLDMHPEQIFVDGSEAYVWIYDPIPIHYWIYGLILLLGAIGICLFPLWPPTLRKGVYYLSVAAAGFLVFILTLTVIRLIIFTLVWFVTAGKLHFWILPNLTEDVGFFASFWPLYESKYVTDEKSTKSERKSKSKSKKIKEKETDIDEPATTAAKKPISLKPEQIEEIKESPEADAMLLRRRKLAVAGGTTDDAATNSSGGDNSDTTQRSAGGDSDAKCSRTPSESESEISGKDYEIISTSEVQNVQ